MAKFIKNYKVFILVVIALSLAISLLIWLLMVWAEKGAAEGKIALIRIEGFITASQPIFGVTASSEEITKFLKKAKENEEIKAIVIRINSPGGSPAAAEEIYREIIELKKSKPVVVSMADNAASAAYYLATSASKIIALPSSEVGSIGAIAIFPQFGGLLKKLGVDVAVLKTGDFKDLSFPFRAKTDEEKKLVQTMLDDILEQFIERVAEGRNVDKEKVRELADGRLWTGRQAKELGLIDEFGGLNEALDQAAKLAGIEKYEVIEMKEQRDLLQELFFGLPTELGSDFVKAVLSEYLSLRVY